MTSPRIVYAGHLQRSKCVECDAHVRNTTGDRPYAILALDGPRCVGCAAKTPDMADFAAIFQLIPAGQPPCLSVSIVRTPPGLSARSADTLEPINVRAYEIRADNGTYLDRVAGEDRATAFAAALHEFFGTAPAPRELPPPPPPPEAPEVVARRERDARILRLVTSALGGDPSQFHIVNRAVDLIHAIELLNA